MNFSVNSEVGTLRQAIVHRPGLELDRLTPLNVDDLLFDDVMWASRAKEEHDLFSGQLRSHGVVVHEFSQLLTEALDIPGAREFLVERLTIATRFGPALDKPLELLVSSTPAAELADILIGGLLKRDILPLLQTSSLLIDHLDDNDFLLTPLPNHLFQRDNSAWVYDGLSINPMTKQARKRETVNSQVVYNFHPMFAGTINTVLYGNDGLNHEPANIEGGDVTVIGNGAVLIGMGERTTPQGLEFLAQQLYALVPRRIWLTHRYPDIGVDEVDAEHPGSDVLRLGDPGARPGRDLLGGLDDIGRVAQRGRTDHPDIHAHHRPGHQQRVGRVVAGITDIGERDLRCRLTGVLGHGEHVAERLSGMPLIGQPVPDRYTRRVGQCLDRGLRKAAVLDPVVHSTEHAGSVPDGLLVPDV